MSTSPIQSPSVAPIDAARLAADVGRRVRETRTARAWTVDQLAARSGVSTYYVADVEAGNALPSLVTLLYVARALGVSLSRLVEGR